MTDRKMEINNVTCVLIKKTTCLQNDCLEPKCVLVKNTKISFHLSRYLTHVIQLTHLLHKTTSSCVSTSAQISRTRAFLSLVRGASHCELPQNATQTPHSQDGAAQIAFTVRLYFTRVAFTDEAERSSFVLPGSSLVKLHQFAVTDEAERSSPVLTGSSLVKLHAV